MDPKPLTIQELETLNLADYKDKPDELLKIGKDLLKAKRFEKSIEVLEEALKQNIKKSKNEFSIDCAKSYFYYADALIYKLQETGEMFQAVNVKPKEESKEQHSVANNNFNNNSDDIQVSKISQSQKPNLMVEGEEKLDNMEENDFIDDEESFEEETDEQIAFYNLAVSEKILKEFLTKYEGFPLQELPEKVIDYFLDLSDIYLKFGELEQIKSDFKLACDFFNQSLELKKKYDDKHSRAVAEVYYMIAHAADFDAKLALVCFYKTYLIMRKHLLKEYRQESEINIEFDSIQFEEIKFNDELMIFHENDKEEVIELKQIMAELKQKIEDVSEEVKLMDALLLEKQNATKKNEFVKNYDEKNLIDLSKTSGIIKKRVKEENPMDSSGKVAKIVENGVTKIITSPSNKDEQKANPDSQKENDATI